jgi:hypothetical protein
MPNRVALLNAKQLANWKPAKAGEELIDGAAPGLRAHRFTKGLSWSLSIRMNGKRRRIALGYGLGLAEAWEKARSVIAWCNAAPHIAAPRNAAPRNAVNASRVNLSELLLAKLRELIREAITELLSDGDVLARIRGAEGTATTRASLPHHLYRHFDKNGALLYVGISLSAFGRAAQHRMGSRWFNAVKSMTIEAFPTRKAARRAEIAAQQTERPLFKHRRVAARRLS